MRFQKSPGDERFGQLPAAYVQFMRECSHDIRFKPQWPCIAQVQGQDDEQRRSGLHQANISVGSAQAEARCKPVAL